MDSSMPHDKGVDETFLVDQSNDTLHHGRNYRKWRLHCEQFTVMRAHSRAFKLLTSMKEICIIYIYVGITFLETVLNQF